MRDLTKGNIYISFILFAIPLVFSGILSQAYNMLDTVIAGKFLGESGLAAIGATSQAVTLASSVFWGFGAGFGIYVAKLFGAKDYHKIKSYIYNVLLIMTLIVLLFSMMIIIFSNIILKVLRVESDIWHDSRIYFNIYIAGLFAVILNNTFIHIMNAFGTSSFSFCMSLVSAVLNVSGNILSVVVLKLGVAGISLSSVLTALVVDVCFVFKLKSYFIRLGVVNERFKLSVAPFRHTLRFTLPTSLQQTAMYISAFAISPIVNGIGSAATASYTVIMRIYDINAGIYQNSSKTLGNYVAQCVGAGKYNKIRKSLFVGLVQAILLTLPVVLLCIIYAKPVNAFFFPKGYAGEALDYAVLFSRIYLPFILFNLINNLFHSFFRGVAAMRLLIIATVLGSVFRIAASLIFSYFLAMDGVYIGWVVSWIAEAVFMFAVYILKFRTTDMIQSFVAQGLNK